MHGVFEHEDRAAQLVALGEERHRAGDLANARAMFQGALETDWDNWAATLNLGPISDGPHRHAATVVFARKAVALNPKSAKAWSNLGIGLWRCLRFDDACSAALIALELDPQNWGAHHNMGIILYSLREYEKSIEHLQTALAINPDNKNARSDLSMSMMGSGDLAGGLRAHEVRWEILDKSPLWQSGLPLWRGEPLDRRTILVHHEQGFGDTIQFVRFLRDLRERHTGTTIIFAGPESLRRLLEGQCEVSEFIDWTNPGEIVRVARDADFHAPLLNVVCEIGAGFSRENAKPYLRAPSSPGARRASYRTPGVKLSVGLVWAASPGHERSRNRSVPIEQLLDLGAIPGVRLYSMQVGEFRDDLIRTGADFIVTDLTPQITNWGDTADILAGLDLLISVDTGIAHLMGALGKRVFVFNPLSPCWRWCRGAEVWYERMRLFDQQRVGDWSQPIEQMAAAIKEMIE